MPVKQKICNSTEYDIQDSFLISLCEKAVPVTVYLVNGVKLQGTLTKFDNQCLMLRRDNHAQLVYKNAVSTILPDAPIDD